jgi:hypothetical protein
VWNNKWTWNPDNNTINESTTVTATFDHATYTVTATGLGLMATSATHGTLFTFTPSVDGKIVTDVTAKISDTTLSLTRNTDGSYTIDGNAITGNITITATPVDVSFINAGIDGYVALGNNQQIFILKASKLTDQTYTLGEGTTFYWSSKYNDGHGAYVAIVGSSETAVTLAAKLTTNDAATVELAYDGNVNGEDSVDVDDVAMAADILNNATLHYTPSDKMLLELDVNGDMKFTSSDLGWITETALGKSHTGSDT